MCQPASMVLTKDNVFWSRNTESHSEIISEFKLHEEGARGINLACVEIVPPDGDFTKPLDQWKFKLDGDRAPHWYDAADAEARARAMLPEWLTAKVILLGQVVEKVETQVIVSHGKVGSVVRGGTIQSVYGGTIQYVYGGTIQSVYGGTIQSVCGGTIQSVRGGTIQSVCGGTIQSVCGGTIQSVCGGTIQSVYGGTIQYVYGGTIQSVYGGTIQSVDGGTIQSVCERANITTYTTIKPEVKGGNPVMIDRSDYNNPRIFVAGVEFVAKPKRVRKVKA